MRDWFLWFALAFTSATAVYLAWKLGKVVGLLVKGVVQIPSHPVGIPAYAGKHQWVVITAVHVRPTQWRLGGPVGKTMGPLCFYCEGRYSEGLALLPCTGAPPE